MPLPRSSIYHPPPSPPPTTISTATLQEDEATLARKLALASLGDEATAYDKAKLDAEGPPSAADILAVVRDETGENLRHAPPAPQGWHGKLPARRSNYVEAPL